MTHRARHVALLGPAAIAIHDDGNVFGQVVWCLRGHFFGSQMGASKRDNQQRCHGHFEFVRLTQQIDQHHGAHFTIVGLVGGFEPFEGALHNQHLVTWGKQALHLRGRGVSQKMNQLSRNFGRVRPKTDQFANTQRGANGRPVFCDVSLS